MKDMNAILQTHQAMKKNIVMTAAILVCGACVLLSACKGSDTTPVSGTLEGPLTDDSIPASTLKTIESATRFHTHDIMSDTVSNISVCSIDEVDVPSGQTTTDGYGIVVTKNATSTNFLRISHAREPEACYDATSGNLWLTTCAMWGTGVQVECLRLIRFHENDSAYIAATVNPYDVQQALCQRLGYHIDGQQLTLYDGRREIATNTNTITDMGGFDDEQPLWIGEQIQYDLSGDRPRLLITPGVKFTTGLVLIDDDMPTLAAPITLDDNGKMTISDLEAVK